MALEQSSRSIPYTEISLGGRPVCLVLGNEVSGVSSEILDLSETVIEIPMLGSKQSLNVSTAGGICMYKFLEFAEK